jgi:hypothetical protein
VLRVKNNHIKKEKQDKKFPRGKFFACTFHSHGMCALVERAPSVEHAWNVARFGKDSLSHAIEAER